MSQRHRYPWVQWLRRLYQSHCLPLLLGVIATIAVFGLWQQLLVQEQLHVQQLVQQAANGLELELNRQLSGRILALQRIANRWQVSGGTPKAFWEADAANYINQYFGFQAIEWVDPSFHVRWVVPSQGNEQAQNFDLSQEYRRKITLQIARDLRQTILTRTISLTQGGEGFLACIPLFVDSNDALPETERFDGFIVGVFRFKALFDSILQASPRYTVQIFDRNGLIYRQREIVPSPLSKTVVVQAYGADWRVQVSPTSALIAEERSLLPTVVLWGGLVSAWTFALTIYLGQRSARHARQVREMNQSLEKEIAYRRQVEASLRANEERWQLALRGNNDGIWDWNVQTNQVFFSNRWKEMLGFADHEISDHLDEWSKRVHPEDLGWVTEAVQDHFAQKTPFYISEYRVQCKDGAYKWILDRGQALWDEAGNVIRMTGSHTDITDRKQAEVALRESEQRYRQLISHIHAGFVVHAPNTQILQCNATACELLGLSMEQILGKATIDPAWHFIREDGTMMPAEEYPINRVLLTQAPLKNYVMGMHRGTQSPIWVLVTAFPEFDASDHLKQVVVTFIDITQLKQAETDLREMAEVMEHAITGISKLDIEGRYLYVNKAYADITGYQPEELIGISWQQTVHPSDLESLRSAYQQMVETGKVEIEAKGIRKDSSSFYKQLVLISTYDKHQQFVGHYCFMKDISDRKGFEAALRHSEATKQAIIQAIPDLLIRMRSDGSYVDFISNSRFNIVKPEQIRQDTTVYNILPPDLAQMRMQYTQQALATGITQIYEHEIVIAEKQCYEEVRIVPILQDEVLVMVRDITDRKQAEEDLRQQKEMFQAIVNHIPVMIALFHDQGLIEFINPALEQTLGWSFEEWQQRDILVNCYPDPTYRQRVLDHMLAATGYWKDFTTLNAHGQLLETAWANVRLSGGRFLGIGQDISDRKHKELALRQAMEAAEAANLAKSIFLANMSHELRTPLNVILGFTQVMAHDSSLTPTQQEDLQTIQRSGDHLLNLINDVLDLSKIEVGHSTIEEAGFDLISLLHTLRSMMTERADAKQLQLTFDIAPEVPQFVIADEQKLRQVLLNLLSNAIKFTKQGSVTLRVTSQTSRDKRCSALGMPHNEGAPINVVYSSSHTVQFEVIDTGVGIAAKEQDTIFDAFVQADAGRKSTSGTGLGLTISRKLLELMNGTISVRSTPNVGSTFTITVPVCPTSSIPIQPEQHNRILGLVPGQPHYRILVVDDQSENRLLMVRLLTQLGLEVREATNGQDAVHIWQEWQPDLIWMDIRMSGLDGYEATKQIRAMEQEQASIIIALTAQASQSDRTLALAAGCNDYISKPFREETIFLKMAEYLGLEYLYAEANPLPDHPSLVSSSTNPNRFTILDPAIVAYLPPEWLHALEDATLCGDDRAILELVAQLSPALTPLSDYLADLANQFQFEQILNWIHHDLREDADGNAT